MLTPQEAKKLREQERKKLRDKSYKMKETKKTWKLTNTNSFANIDEIDFLLNNSLDISNIKAFRAYRKNEK